MEGRDFAASWNRRLQQWKSWARTARASPPPSAPAFLRQNYEVGPEFRDRFMQADSANARFFVHADAQGHFRFDLEAFAAARLEAAGIGESSRCRRLHLCARSAIFSASAAPPTGQETDYGRQISAIMLRG